MSELFPFSTNFYVHIYTTAPNGKILVPLGAFWAFFAPNGIFFFPLGAGGDQDTRLVTKMVRITSGAT